MMIIPRQILYKQFLSHYLFIFFFKSKFFFKKTIDCLKTKLSINKNMQIYFTSKGRIALYHIVKFIVKKNSKKKILMSPLTIFDLVNIVKSAGGEPVFIDHKKNSFEMNLELIKKEIKNKNVGAILLTHYALNSNQIALISKICKRNKIYFIQDCAISLFSKYKKNSIVNYSDFSFFSFGTFKFVSLLFGGAIIFKKNSVFMKFLKNSERYWPYQSLYDYFNQIIKSLIIKLASSKIIFTIITFPIFKFSEIYNFKFILKFSKNDPNPKKSFILPVHHKKKIFSYIVSLIPKLIDQAIIDTVTRENNYNFLLKKIKNRKIKIFKNFDFKHKHSYINFPIVVKNDRKKFINYLLKHNIDSSYYFYRNCSNIDIFKIFKYRCFFLDSFVSRLIYIPIHPRINKKKLLQVASIINKY